MQLEPSTIFSHWSFLINYALQSIDLHAASVCYIDNENFDDIQLYVGSKFPNVSFVHINVSKLDMYISEDVYFEGKKEHLDTNNIRYDEFLLVLIATLERSHCEIYIAFQEHIPFFSRAFYNASIISIWRSTRTHFIFAYVQDQQKGQNYFEEYIFHDQANMLILKAESMNSSTIYLETNRFVGSIHDRPNQMIPLDEYDVKLNKFKFEHEIFPNKFLDLQGREIIMGAFDYRPFVAVDFNAQPNMFDIADDNPKHSVLVDGTEARVFITFCELFNCTVQGDTCWFKRFGKYIQTYCYFIIKAEKGEWGVVYKNLTAEGLIGNILKRRIHVGLCAMYSWYADYAYLDLTVYLGRSGATCMVPAPKRLSSWYLPLKPFQFTLWLGVVGCLILEIISLFITRQFEQTFAEQDNSWKASFQFGYIVTLKLFISQGTDYVVNSTTVRTVLFACYMIDMIVTSIYSGGLAAILTIPAYDEAPDSVERLNQFGLEWSASSLAWTQDIKEPGLLDHFTVNSQEVLQKRAYTDNIGLVVERMTFNHFGNVDIFTPESIGRFKLMVDDFYYQWTVAFVPRLWAFLPKFNRMMYNIHSSGFDKFWEWQKTAQFTNENIQNQMATSQYTNTDPGVVPLGMNNFAGVLVIWILGMITSILAFLAEYLFFHFSLKRKFKLISQY